MFNPYPADAEPSDDQFVWRYLDLAKYIDLISRKKLFLARVGLMEDRFEGTYTRRHVPTEAEIANIIEYARTNQPDLVAGHEDDKLRAIIRASREASLATVEAIRNFAFINCWHINSHESAGMWKLYLKSNEGVAIRTRYGLLKQSVAADLPGCLFLVGKITYLDYDVETIPHNEFFMPFMRKRLSFQHENELRLACIDIDSTVTVDCVRDELPQRQGYFIPVLHSVAEDEAEVFRARTAGPG